MSRSSHGAVRVHETPAAITLPLNPVIVIEFDDFADPFTKSKALLRRCAVALFDVSFSDSGWEMEVTLAQEWSLPFWAGYVSWTSFDPPHVWPMTKGLLKTLGVGPVGAPDDDARAEAAAWLRSRAATANVPDEKSTSRGGEPLSSCRPPGRHQRQARLLHTGPSPTVRTPTVAASWKNHRQRPRAGVLLPTFRSTRRSTFPSSSSSTESSCGDQPPLDPWTLLPPEAKMGRDQVE